MELSEFSRRANGRPTRAREQYRRGLYTWWQRTFLHPSLLAFDAPTREECTVDRVRSNTPLQALVLLNDPTYIEAARAFAARILREGGGDPSARLDWAFRQALARPADEHELAVLVAAGFAQHRSDSSRSRPSAAKLLAVGDCRRPADLDPAELAAWTQVARVIFNLHEFVTRNGPDKRDQCRCVKWAPPRRRHEI